MDSVHVWLNPKAVDEMPKVKDEAVHKEKERKEVAAIQTGSSVVD